MATITEETSSRNDLVNTIRLMLSAHSLENGHSIKQMDQRALGLPWNTIRRSLLRFPNSQQLHANGLVGPHCCTTTARRWHWFGGNYAFVHHFCLLRDQQEQKRKFNLKQTRDEDKWKNDTWNPLEVVLISAPNVVIGVCTPLHFRMKYMGYGSRGESSSWQRQTIYER